MNAYAYATCAIEYDRESKTYLPRQFDKPTGFELRADFATVAERDAFIARFPKYVGVKASRSQKPMAWMSVRFRQDGVTGDRNEVGVKRALKALEIGGFDWHLPNIVNHYDNAEQFRAAVAAL